MADVSHELGSLRFVVSSPLSSRVAMFNNQFEQHKQAQLLSPFSTTDGRSSPKPTFSKEEYGKPLAGSLTEMRGQKANIHVIREMLELCHVINSEGYPVKDEPSMRVIPFGELFNIYSYISDKVVGILLRARKHKLVEFEGEMLFQRRDDDVPIFLIKPIAEIGRELEEKMNNIRCAVSASPQATSVLLDKQMQGLGLPGGASPRSSVSRTPSPPSARASSPAPPATKEESIAAPTPINLDTLVNNLLKGEEQDEKVTSAPEATEHEVTLEQTPTEAESVEPVVREEANKEKEAPTIQITSKPIHLQVEPNLPETPAPVAIVAAPGTTEENKADINNNKDKELPAIVLEASASNVTKTADTTENDIEAETEMKGETPSQATSTAVIAALE